MSKIADEAGKFIFKVLMDPATPVGIKTGIRTDLMAPSARETALRIEIAIVNNSANPAAARIAAMREVIKFYKGDR